MTVAVIGGGAFGMMTAIRLAELGQAVTLFERLPGLMQGTSFNANRLHQGFHYPRDEETARQCLRGYDAFRREFGEAILDGCFNAYFIAKEGSLTSPDAYLAFCDRMALPYAPIDLCEFRPAVENVALGISAREVVFDPDILRRLMMERLKRAGVAIRTKCEVADVRRDAGDGFILSTSQGRARFDSVVNCSYADINRLSARLGHGIDVHRYEYTAVALVELDWPDPISITVMDGPFVTLLPFCRPGQYLVYHVKHSVIVCEDTLQVNPAWLDPDTSPFRAADRERWTATLLESCSRFVPVLRDARVVGLLQAPRMVLANCEDTDARPSIVTQHESGYISVFSGKVVHCVWTADEVVRELGCRNDIGPMDHAASERPAAELLRAPA